MSKLSGGILIAPAETSLTRHSTAKIAVGSKVRGDDGEFVYVKAGGAITASGDPVSVTTGLDAVVRGDSGVGAFIGIAEAPFASGEYGFIRVSGPAEVVVESGASAGGLLELSGTVGKLKAITTSGSAVAIINEASDDDSTARVSVLIKPQL
jgi:hypothetical protein